MSDTQHDSSEPVKKKPKLGEEDGSTFSDIDEDEDFDWNAELGNVGDGDSLKPNVDLNEWVKKAGGVYWGKYTLPPKELETYVDSCKLALQRYYESYDFVSLEKGIYRSKYFKLSLLFKAKEKNKDGDPASFKALVRLTTAEGPVIISCKRIASKLSSV